LCRGEVAKKRVYHSTPSTNLSSQQIFITFERR
jgi:hypothetical protein